MSALIYADQATRGSSLDIVQFLPLLIILALLYFFIVRPLMRRSKIAQSEGKNVIQSIPYTRFILVGLALIAASYFFSSYVSDQMLRDASTLDQVRIVANVKYYSWGAFFLGILIVCFGGIKALLDQPKQPTKSE